MHRLSCACLAALFLTSIAPVHAQGPEAARANPAQPPFPAGDTSYRTEAATAASPPAAPLAPAAAAVQPEPPFAGTPLALPPASAATPAAPAADVPTPRRTFDVSLAPGFGYFLYPQYVDGGYYVHGRPYNLVWSGLQLHFTGDIHWYFPGNPKFGLGAAGAFMLTPNPSGADWGGEVTVDPNRKAMGGYLAASGCFWPTERWRLEARSGYGGTGDYGHYGGWGFALGFAAHRLYGSGPLAVGLGLRALSLVLSYPAHGTTRGEWGVYSTLLFEVLFDIATKR